MYGCENLRISLASFRGSQADLADLADMFYKFDE